jgi:hypothetical protein
MMGNLYSYNNGAPMIGERQVDAGMPLYFPLAELTPRDDGETLLHMASLAITDGDDITQVLQICRTHPDMAVVDEVTPAIHVFDTTAWSAYQDGASSSEIMKFENDETKHRGRLVVRATKIEPAPKVRPATLVVAVDSRIRQRTDKHILPPSPPAVALRLPFAHEASLLRIINLGPGAKITANWAQPNAEPTEDVTGADSEITPRSRPYAVPSLEPDVLPALGQSEAQPPANRPRRLEVC